MQAIGYEFTGFNHESFGNIVEAIKKGLKGFEVKRFLLGCRFPDSLSEDEKASLKKDVQPLIVNKTAEALSAEPDFENFDAEIVINFNQDLIFFRIVPVYVSGKYNKYSREITQTLHFCFKCKGRGCPNCNKTGILTKESVQSVIAEHAVKAFGASGMKFHGAGREDKDVRMLGSGRKFVIELVEPKKRKSDLEKLEKEINKAEKERVEVHGLKESPREEVAKIKSEASDKLYEAIVECKKTDEKKLVELKGKKFDVVQRTPNRVKARRADLDRKRRAEIKSVEKLSAKKFRIQIKAESGLYIKEFISGDGDRTNPSLAGLLGVKCGCVELDVLEIL